MRSSSSPRGGPTRASRRGANVTPSPQARNLVSGASRRQTTRFLIPREDTGWCRALNCRTEEGHQQPFPRMGKCLSIRLGGNDPDQAAVLFVALEVVVSQSNDVAPRHQWFEADRRALEGDPDIRAPALRFGNVDQDRLGRDRFPDLFGQCRGEPRLDVATRQRIEEKIPQSGVQLEGTRSDLDGSLVDLTVAQSARQALRSGGHRLGGEALQE